MLLKCVQMLMKSTHCGTRSAGFRTLKFDKFIGLDQKHCLQIMRSYFERLDIWVKNVHVHTEKMGLMLKQTSNGALI